MPIQTENTAKVKNSYSQGMPKNLSEYMDKVNEKFLNNSLATIEDFSLKNPNDGMIQWFKDYQNRYFNSVLLKDSFLKIDELGNFGNERYYKGMSIQNSGFLGSLTNKVNGATLTVGGTGSDVGLEGTIFCGKATGTIGDYYDKAGVNVAVDSTGNIRTGAYQDSADPTAMTLYQQSSSTATSGTGFNDLALTEFALLTTSVWICMQVSTDTDLISRGGTTDRRTKNQGFGAFPNPLSGYTQNLANIQCPNMRLSHSW